MEKTKWTTIRIEKSTRHNLRLLWEYGDTYNTIIKRLSEDKIGVGD